ncbi:type IV pilus secretin PilQ [Uliginosibacterium sp. sgz301328]|uniref:type IV pilus secretin PilQ n=1 Tax=Uliginosibacterium sp. sgz301328 TaxID=3243764 RepID=UPI00359D8CC5
MKIGTRLSALCLSAGVSLMLAVPVAHAQTAQPAAAPAAATAKNAIESIGATSQGGNVIVRVTLRQPFDGQLGSFSVSNPSRVAIDFPGTSNALGRNAQTINEGDVRSANVVQVADRTRLVLNLNRALTYDTRVEGRDVVITLSAATAKSPEATTTARFAEQKGGPDQHSIRDLNFRRGPNGEGRIVVDLSDANTGIDIRQQGSDLVVDFLKTSLPQNLSRRLDVTDFATPVTSVSTTQQGGMVRLVVSPKGLWEHNAYQSDNQFVLEVKPVQEDPRKLVQGGDNRQKYAGEKLSLNFQNIDVRSVLQVIADFTNFNIITSDSVTGNVTLRLKDVPWDQALDIILQAKGLDMRKNGNVIWIAPRDELAAREKLQLEARSQIQDLEPLRTESFQINYHNAKQVSDFLKGKDQTVLSKRGTVAVDERSNKIFVTDINSQLEALRALIAEIDVPVRQVLIEAQIVEATDTFSRNLGVRLGFGSASGSTAGTNSAGNTIPRTTIGGGLGSTAYQAGLTDQQPIFSSQGLALNLPASSIGDKAAGALSFVLWNSAATRFLTMEVSALEADGRGKVVSRPRVMTADQVEALIEQGTEIPYQQATSSGATSVSFRKANLALRVRPQITPDGRVFLSLDVNKDTPNTSLSTGSGIAIDTKHVRTDVLVENGGTVVIGGIYQQTVGNTTTKVPLLGDVPYLGALFRNNERSDDKTELLVFITPRIVTDQALAR